MKFFIDTANIDEIKKADSMGFVDGVTTNPTLVSRENRPFLEVIREICEVVNGPVSVEAVGLTAEALIPEARELAKIHANVVVKIPMNLEGMIAVRQLEREGIKTNVTLVFSPNQALLAMKAGASYISPFVGRLDDVAHEGMDMVADCLDIIANYGFSSEIIVASIRHPLHVLTAARMGAHIATIPYKVMVQLAKHPLTDAGIERFLQDWEKVPKT
jgi:transaldolase